MNDKNALTTSKPQLPDAEGRISDLMIGLTNIRNTIQGTGGVAAGLPFLSINAAGLWGFGQDRIEVEANSLWAIDVRTWKQGYIAWPGQGAKERKPLGERMVPASAPMPDITTLPNVGQPYQVQFSFELLCMSGQDAGTKVLYKNGSYGCKVAVQDLVEKVNAQALVDQTKLCPVVMLEIRSYYHTEWKKDFYNPILKIQKWIAFEDYDAFAGVPTPESEAAAEAVEDDVDADIELQRMSTKLADADIASRTRPRPEPEVAARGTGRRAPAPAPKPVPRRPGQRTQPRA